MIQFFRRTLLHLAGIKIVDRGNEISITFPPFVTSEMQREIMAAVQRKLLPQQTTIITIISSSGVKKILLNTTKLDN